jgi:hypothetical protein
VAFVRQTRTGAASTKFEHIVNPENAKALGLAGPLSRLGRADEVIE